MAENKRLVLIVCTPSYFRVTNALSIAVTAAAVGIDTRIYFTYGGILRLKKDFVDYIGDETDMWIRDKLQSSLDKGSIPKISELLDTLVAVDAKIYACPSAMAFHNISKDELVEHVTEIRSVGHAIKDVIDGKTTVIYV